MNLRTSNSSSGAGVKLAIASAVVALTLSACGEPVPPNDSVAQRPETTTSRTMPGDRPVTAPAQSVPPAAPTDTTPPATTPSTHSGAPKEAPAAAPTARDTPGQAAASKTLSPAEESRSMPMPGQSDNHFTPSADPRKTDAPKQ